MKRKVEDPESRGRLIRFWQEKVKDTFTPRKELVRTAYGVIPFGGAVTAATQEFKDARGQKRSARALALSGGLAGDLAAPAYAAQKKRQLKAAIQIGVSSTITAADIAATAATLGTHLPISSAASSGLTAVSSTLSGFAHPIGALPAAIAEQAAETAGGQVAGFFASQAVGAAGNAVQGLVTTGTVAAIGQAFGHDDTGAMRNKVLLEYLGMAKRDGYGQWESSRLRMREALGATDPDEDMLKRQPWDKNKRSLGRLGKFVGQTEYLTLTELGVYRRMKAMHAKGSGRRVSEHPDYGQIQTDLGGMNRLALLYKVNRLFNSGRVRELPAEAEQMRDRSSTNLFTRLRAERRVVPGS